MPRPPATGPHFDDATPADAADGPRPKGHRTNNIGNKSQEQHADFVRDLLINRFDVNLLPMIEAVLRRHGVLGDGLGLAIIQDMQVVCFPEAFLEPSDKPHAGMIPLGGRMKAATATGWAALAERMRSQAEAEGAGRR